MAELELKPGDAAYGRRGWRGVPCGQSCRTCKLCSAEVLWGRGLINWAVNPVNQSAAPSIHHDFCFIL